MSLITTTLEEFNWLDRYLVSKSDMTSLQLWLQMWGAIAAQQTGGQGVIVNGLSLTVGSVGNSTTFDVGVGFGTDQTGKPLIVNTPLTLNNTTTYADNIKGILVLKFAGTANTPTTTPAESGNLKTLFGAALQLVMGTAAASPSYPTITDGLILGGFTFNAAGVLTQQDSGIVSYPRVGIKGDTYLTPSTTNPTIIPFGAQLVHYNYTMAASGTMAVSGTFVTGNVNTSGGTLNATSGLVVSQF